MSTTRNDMAVLHALKAMETTISQSRPDDGILETVRVTISNMEAAMADPVAAAAHRLYDLLSRAFDALDGEEESVKEEHADLIEDMSDLLDELNPGNVAPPEPVTRTYTFDLELYTAIRVTAPNLSAARNLLQQCINGVEANFGAWPNGDPIIGTVGIPDDTGTVVEIDGEAV